MEIKIIYQEIEELKKRIYALKEHFQEQIITKEDKIEGKGLSTNDYTDSEKQDNIDNTTARHTHSNKALLDAYTQTEEDITDSVTKKHSHSNKTILDNTTASFTSDLKTKLDDIDANNLVYYEDLLTKVYPVGSVYISVISTSPQSFLGGTWVTFGAGRVLLGMGSNGETNYTAVEDTGGNENSVALHTHTQNSHNHTQNAHGHGRLRWNQPTGTTASLNSGGSSYKITWSGLSGSNSDGFYVENNTATNNSFTATNNNAGILGGNRMPYITVYMWKRTA